MSLEPIATRFQFLPQEVFAGEPRHTSYLVHPLSITVEWRGGGTWAVLRGSGWDPQLVWCEVDGVWEYEPIPSSRTSEFLARTRYPLDQAMAIGAVLAERGPGPVRPRQAE